MSGLNEVPTDELLSFQDFPAIHSPSTTSRAQINVDITQQSTNAFSSFDAKEETAKSKLTYEEEDEVQEPSASKSFWTIEYYQQFFNVDTTDVLNRIVGSIVPVKDSTFKHDVKARPDLYGPFWIAVTLVFTIAISGNIVNYFHHVNTAYHWKYNFHLVSQAATAIITYISIVPLTVWGLLKWSVHVIDLDGLENGATPKILELICIYGYSLFIYIPISVLWMIQVNWFQWLLVMVAALLSGSVLLLTLAPALRSSKHRLILMSVIITCHLLLAVGFMLYFFHNPTVTEVPPSTNHTLPVSPSLSTNHSLPLSPSLSANHSLPVSPPLNVSANKTHKN